MKEIKVQLKESDLDEVAQAEIKRLERRVNSLEGQVEKHKREIKKMQDNDRKARALIKAVKDSGDWYDDEEMDEARYGN